MAKRRTAVILEYVEARREVEVLKRQLAADPSRAKSPVWAKFFHEAKVQVAVLSRGMRGGDLGKAERLLAEGAPVDRPA